MKTALHTSLGPELRELADGNWEIDLDKLRIFTGLSILSGILGDLILEEIATSPADISILYKINSNINPELVDMHLTHIQVASRASVLKDILLFREEFQTHIRNVFGTFQRLYWAQQLHPEFYGKDPKENPAIALVFPYHHVSPNEVIDYQFILERSESPVNKGEFFLRLTVETFSRANLNLATIPHAVVNDLTERVFIAGSTKLADMVANHIQMSSASGARIFTEDKRTHHHIFQQISKTYLGELDRLSFQWDSSFSSFILSESPSISHPIIKKIFLTLEDHIVCEFLKSGKPLKVLLGKHFATLYLTRRNRVFNCDFNLEKKLPDMGMYLQRMPKLLSAGKSIKPDTFAGHNIFLIHHITSEILGFLEFLRGAGARKIHIGFVKYSGVTPPGYLDMLAELPSNHFVFAGLMRRITDAGEDYYTISTDYPEMDTMQTLQEYFTKKKLKYFDAMKFLSWHMFLRLCMESAQSGQKVLLIEDGGYLAPEINRYCREGLQTSEVFKMYKITPPENAGSFREWLSPILIGTVEHTRNGYDRLLNEEKTAGALTFPAFSIALSQEKTKEESKEVSHSILNAIESIMNGQGFSLSRRNCMILGSEGNIGSFLQSEMVGGRMHEANREIVCVDISISNSIHCKFKTIQEVPESLLLQTDLFIGVIGKSILTEELLKKIIFKGTHKNLFFASGSTKTLEFEHLTSYLAKLKTGSDANREYSEIQIVSERILDPQSGQDQGGLVRIIYSEKGIKKEKKLYLLGDLSPINFLYYGVPTEGIDPVIAELGLLSAAMTRLSKNNQLPKPSLYALDLDIRINGELIN